MEYIRTKEAIYKVDGYDDRGVCVCNGKTFYRNEYIDIADTIEELCDEFVNVSGVSKEIRITGEYHLVEYSLNIIKGMSGITYGAVWCEWGLKYVAKLDDKGEWHLL
jgi:hypothetical protein